MPTDPASYVAASWSWRRVGSADMVASLETGIEANVTSAEEEAILREFEQADRAAESKPKEAAQPTRPQEPTPRIHAEPRERIAEDDGPMGDEHDPPSKLRDRDAEAS